MGVLFLSFAWRLVVAFGAEVRVCVIFHAYVLCGGGMWCCGVACRICAQIVFVEVTSQWVVAVLRAGCSI